jgi:hypothetical protein
MRVRALSPTGDYTFGQNGQNYLVNSRAAVAQAIYCALRLFMGSWFLDLTQGVPWLQQILAPGAGGPTQGVQSATGKANQFTYDQILQQAIANVQGVTASTSYSSSLQNRNLIVTASVDTLYGSVAGAWTVPTGPTPTPSPAPGPTMQIFMGPWNSTILYSNGQVVTYGGASYMATTSNTGQTPGSSSSWNLLSSDATVTITTIALAPGAPGNFTVAHGLGVVPNSVTVEMTSGGQIWFQNPPYDGNNLYLVASDSGITGNAKCLVAT